MNGSSLQLAALLAPKKRRLRFNISLARCSSRISLEGLIRSASAVLTPTVRPSSISACLTHDLTDSTP